MYELSNFDLVLDVVSQTIVSGGNRTYDPHANSLVHYPLDYKATQTVGFLYIYYPLTKLIGVTVNRAVSYITVLYRLMVCV